MIAVLIAIGAMLVMAEFVVWWRSHSHSYDSPNAESWLDDFSSAAYRPMIRLAEPNDAGYLASQRGLDEAARYRRWQRRALRTYLRRLSRDFQRLHSLAAAAPWRRLKFLLSVWSVEVRLLFTSAIDIRPLLVTIDDLAAQARQRRQSQI